MKFTDHFIKRPVLATVVSTLLLVLGLRAAFSLPVLQYPRTENAVVTVQTVYYGADPDLVAGFITTPIENAIAQANGIDYMTSQSLSGVSIITVNLRLNYDADKALTEINTKVNSVLNQLPTGAQQPVLQVAVGQSYDAMYIGFNSDVLAPNQITDYLVRIVQPRLQAVIGVQTAEILGAKNFALRAWLDPQKLAAYGLTSADIYQALSVNDQITGVGNTKGQMVQVSLAASTMVHSLDEFRRLVVKQSNGAIVRLEDVANVSLGAEDYESDVGFDGKKAVYIGIKVAPSANLLDVIHGVRAVFPDIVKQFPQGLNGEIVFDSTAFVESAIDEVEHTLGEAMVIVTLVVFLFLGSPRSVVIPVIAIPLSLIATFAMMMVFHFSINLLTLLAMVLAIGLVVDDAIIVVENVNRHLEEGKSPLAAALQAARELANPIIAMTVVLVAVYIPIGFQSGLTGALFTEFAFTLVGAVTMSAVVALTLSPMMCAMMLQGHERHRPRWEEFLVTTIDRTFSTVLRIYSRTLHASLDYVPVTATFALLILGSIYFLYTTSKSELAPEEDQGVVFAISYPAPNATLEQRLMYSRQVFNTFNAVPEKAHIFQMDVPGMIFNGLVLKPWSERTHTTMQLGPQVQQELYKVAGLRVVSFPPPSLPGSSGLPIQFALCTAQPFAALNGVAQNFLRDAMATGMFMFLDSDLKYDQPQTVIDIDRDKVAQMGLHMSDVGNALSSMLGGGYVNYFSMEGRSYKVVPQVQQKFRLNADQLGNYYIRTADGTPVTLDTVTKVKTTTIPESINHFQQLNDAVIQGVALPGVTAGEALDALRAVAAKDLPPGYSVDYGGASRQFVQESGGFAGTFAFALVIIFLALAAQFESFRDPFIILVSVPLSIFGALTFISLGAWGTSLNIYTEVGLVTLMGLISKHGILLVEFANTAQKEGMSKREAIEHAASVRLRPILMTTAAMVLGVYPMLAATGAGAISRRDMGLVIASGLMIGTFFTLLVVPAVYMLLGTTHHRQTDGEEESERAAV
jgi:multidrug efflux pump